MAEPEPLCKSCLRPMDRDLARVEPEHKVHATCEPRFELTLAAAKVRARRKQYEQTGGAQQ